MANRRSADLADQVSGKNEAAIHGHGHNESPDSVFARGLSAQLRNTSVDAPSGIRCPSPLAQHFSSAITIPDRVVSSAANSAATGTPPDQTSPAALASPGQPSL